MSSFPSIESIHGDKRNDIHFKYAEGARTVSASRHKDKARTAFKLYFPQDEVRKAILSGNFAELIKRRSEWLDRFAIGQRASAMKSSDVIDYKRQDFKFWTDLDEGLRDLTDGEGDIQAAADTLGKSAAIFSGGEETESKQLNEEQLAALAQEIGKARGKAAALKKSYESAVKGRMTGEGAAAEMGTDAKAIGEEILEELGEEVTQELAEEIGNVAIAEAKEADKLKLEQSGVGEGLAEFLEEADDKEEVNPDFMEPASEDPAQPTQEDFDTMQEAERATRAAAAQRDADNAKIEADAKQREERAKRNAPVERPAAIPQYDDKADLIPAARRSAAQKDRYELRDDIEYFLDSFPDMLREEEKAFAKVDKLSDLRKLHRRIMGKLDKTQGAKKRVGIIVDGDDYLTERITQIMVKNKFGSLKADDVVSMRDEEKRGDTKDYGDFEVRTAPSGRLAMEREPIYTYIPDTIPEEVEEQQRKTPAPVRRLAVNLGNRRYDRVTTARRQTQEDPFKKSYPKVTLKYLY